jgi:predicted cupin superfamily sugar epimerase
VLSPQNLIAALDLKPHPREGGYYRETYRSSQGAPGRKSAGTAIYYLLTPDTFSALHRLPTDEIFHFYLGDPVRMLQLWPDGSGRIETLGPDILAGQQPQLVVPADVWQGSLLAPGGSLALLGCTVAPGFEFSDYEAGDREGLKRRYPIFAELITRLTTATGHA